MTGARLPQGLLSVHALPADHHDGPWDHILVPDGIKERLLSQALLRLRHGRALRNLPGMPHGLMVLAGPPGTGKTTLARGLAQTAARALAPAGATTYIEIDPHAFPSEMLGQSQRNITTLFTDTLPEFAARRPHTVVLIDEVEAFAVRRSAASFGSNPVDVHRATDAVLAGIDLLAGSHPRTVVLATTNFPEAVDEAFLSRADLVLNLDLPDEATIAAILRRTLAELAGMWEGVRPLVCDDGLHRKLAVRCAGWDGRRIRKLVLAALAQRREVALDPNLLEAADLLTAAEAG
ncbi:AAA family ATPase [Pseudonocardia sp. K10HN5]|uniref:AAA family ATPase n=1 Tax=Pseudonocardia acidicola TaxID=2724939 RepID=A0ABX1S7W7_9PSEU|nr:AAA family ATPase [Pseudonocardia acidicola]